MSQVTIESNALRVTVNPQVGGTITGVTHKPTGLSVLGTVPWDSVDAPLSSLQARDEPEWLTRYTGGWPLLFPNAGDACTIEGTFHGFHGEGSISPWEAVVTDATVIMTRSFASLPATMRRTIEVKGETVSIREELSYSGTRHTDVMWGHHPTFGSDLLEGPFEVTCGAQRVEAETDYDPPASPIARGASGTWPLLRSKAGGSADLSHPQRPCSSVAYLTDFTSPWAAIRRLDDAIAIMLTWDGTRFPCAWLWYELAATQDPPWNGRTHLVGIEPNTTPCSLGLCRAISRGAPRLRLEPGSSHSAAIALHVFKPSGPILDGPRDIPFNPNERVKTS